MRALAVTTGIVFWTLVLGVTWLALSPGTNSVEPIAVLEIEPAPKPAPATTAPSGEFDFPPGFAITGPAEPVTPPAAPPPPETTLAPPPGQLSVPALPSGDGLAPGLGEPPADGAPAAEAPPAAGAPPQSETPPAGVVAPAPDAPAPADDQRSDVAPEQSPSAASSAAESTSSASSAMLVAQQSPVTGSPAMDKGSGSISLTPVPIAELVEESEYGPLPKVAADGRRPAEVYARPSPDSARNGLTAPARIAILVNGLGFPGSPDEEVLKGLPGSISVAYGAYGHGLQDEVTKARAAGHEVLLQIPLEPEDYPKEDPGPHTLLTTLPKEENIKRLQWLMSRYTGYVGVTNHMGAKFETTKDALLPVLEELKKRGLIYIDDGTAQSSATRQVAGTLGLDYSTADVQIGSGASGADIAKALAELESVARMQGTAIGVAKAKPETVKQLADWAGTLEDKGLVLVPVSAVVRSQRQS